MRVLAGAFTAVVAPSLRRTLLLRSLTIGLVPIVLIVALALGVSQRLLQERFDDEARLVAGATASAIQDDIEQTSRSSSVLAALSSVRDLAAAREARALRELLIPLKSRLALDVVLVSDQSGLIIAGAQDFAPDEHLPQELLVRARAGAERSYVIYSEPKGLMIRAITPISAGDPSKTPGFVEVGSLLDDSFLKTIRAASDSEIAILVSGDIKVTTLKGIAAPQLPNPATMQLGVSTYSTDLSINGSRYNAIFSLVQSHSVEPEVLVVLLPLGPLEEAQRELAAAVLAGGAVLAVLATVLTYHTARGLTTPLARLASAARRIGEGYLDAPITTGSPHEIGQLEHSFQSMAGALRARGEHNDALVGELRGTNLKLAEANRLKSEFLASVSHEFRTPMNAIIGYSKLMLDGLDGELTTQQRTDLFRVAQAADNLLVIINGLLDFAKIEAGRMDVQPTRFALSEVVDEVVALLAERAQTKRLVLRTDLGAQLLVGWADRHQVRQILTNLVANALKFTDQGEVVIGADSLGEVIQVTVSDTGEGIPADAHEIIFHEFRQADGSASRRHGGTGLGLAIARRLVTMNGGRLWVESEVGVGSKFHFTMPTATPTTSTEVPVADAPLAVTSSRVAVRGD
jgi:signal transduction histidine kinase